MTDPHIQAWRSAHTTLGSRLVDLESQADVAVARTGVLTGATAAAWADAEAGLAHAWETYQVLDEVLARRAVPGRPADLEGDDLGFIRAAAGRGEYPDPRLPVVG